MRDVVDPTGAERKRRERYRRKLGQRVVPHMAVHQDVLDRLAGKYPVMHAAIDDDKLLALAIPEVLEEMADALEEPESI